jgi:uncharacterized protein YcbK (DUF882 family)
MQMNYTHDCKELIENEDEERINLARTQFKQMNKLIKNGVKVREAYKVKPQL